MLLYFSTPVWGAAHIDLFKTVGLPSLLSPSNLPALSEPARCRYFIYTRAQDLERLKECEAFGRLERLMQVEIHLLPDSIDLPYLTFSECDGNTLRRADEDDVAAVFAPPDCVWSDGSFANLQKLADAGHSVVHMTGVRLNKDTAVPALLEHVGDRGALAIPARDLVELGFRHLHPIALSHFWREQEGNLHPANLYWTTPGQGVAARCFHLHPLLIKSQIKFANFASTTDDDLIISACPDPSSEHIVVDSDEILAFELSSPGHQHRVGVTYTKGSVDSAAAWVEIGANARHRQLATHTIRLHYTAIDAKVWAPVEAEAEDVMNEIRRINARPAPLLAFAHPRVFARRVMALLTGKGLFSGRRSQGLTALRKSLFTRLPLLRAVAHKFVQWTTP